MTVRPGQRGAWQIAPFENASEHRLWKQPWKQPGIRVARRPGGEAEIRARLAAAPGLTHEESHRLAGLVDAESHMSIVPNNRGGWRCLLQVALRDDDRDVLTDLRKRLGIGHLSAISAHNTSRPQVKWTVTSKLECAVLSDVLDAHPLRARKLAEYEIWREALSVWCVRRYGLAPGGEARLADLAAAIHAARVYREPAADEAVPSLMDAYAHQYLAGFFSGEGCFQLGPRRARLTVKVRRDDRPLLEGFRRRFRMGSVCDVAVPEPWSPCAAWNVTAAREVLRGIAIFDRAGLLGRKARQSTLGGPAPRPWPWPRSGDCP